MNTKRAIGVLGVLLLAAMTARGEATTVSRYWELGWGLYGGELPWDLKRFRKEIEAELKEPLDLSSEKQALWWGEKYCQVLGEIHRAMKEASGGKPVFYYQNTGCQTLDHL